MTGITIHPVALGVHVIVGTLLMLFALRNSRGLGSWYGHRPFTWFVIAVMVPELAVILIAVNAAAERKKSAV